MWVICGMLLAQNAVVYGEIQGDSRNYLSVVYDNMSGMPTSEANDILQTEDGYIWIGSYSSLLRYDGRDIVAMTEPKGLTSISCLYTDSKGRLWVGTNNNGVAVYENNQFTFIDASAYASSYSARAIVETKDGTILVGTTHGMYEINHEYEITPLTDPLIQSSYITKMVSMGNNCSVAVTKSGELYFIEQNEVVLHMPLSQWEYALPLSLLPMADEQGEYLLIGTNDDYIVSLRYLEDKISWELLETPNLAYINDLMIDVNGRLWVGADSGVGYFEKDGSLHIVNHMEEDEAIEKIMQDFEGNIWLASSKIGVIKLSESMFQNATSGIDNLTQVNGVEVLHGRLYIVSNKGVHILEEESLEPIENGFTRMYDGTYFRCVEQDAQGYLWFSSYSGEGLVRYHPESEEIVVINESNGLDYGRIRSTYSGADGRIWIATGNGVYLMEGEIITAHFGNEEGLENLEILTLAEDKQGRIFVGTDGSGMYIIDTDFSVSAVGRREGLPSDIIMRIEQDPDTDNNRMWIVTSTSISYYEEGVVTNVDKFPYENNFDVLFYQDTVVVLSSSGIYFVEKEEMLSSKTELSYIHKNQLDGLFSTTMPNSFSKIYDGVLYLCGTSNLSVLSLHSLQWESSYIPPIHITGIHVKEDFILPEKQQFYLGKTADYLEIDVLIPTYSLQDYSVSYMLEGYDLAPRISHYSEFMHPTYTNLPGGTYSFQVALIDNRTGQFVNEGVYEITKEYTFTEHPVFRVFLFLLLLFLGWLIVVLSFKVKEYQNKKEQQRLQGLFDEIVEAFSKVIDAKDKYTNGHSKRVALYTKELVQELGFPEEDVKKAYGVALLHDVGKITIPDAVLNKPTKLTEEERALMKAHTENGAEILAGMKEWPDIIVGAKFHHECYDGTGHGKLKGTEIPEIARIIGVADAFDAMYSSRSYRKKTELSYAIGELEKNKGTQFDPDITDTFIRLLRSDKLNYILSTVK